MKSSSICYVLGLFFLKVVPIYEQILENYNLDRDLKTVQLYNVTTDDNGQKLSPAVRSLTGNDYLIFEFDDLLDEYRQFHVKIVRCNVQWEAADTREIQYLADFNDFIINRYQNSQGTKVSYFHYAFRVPEVKLSGNYVLQLFEDSVFGEPILQRRFRVYEPLVGISARVVPPVDNAFWRTHQQVEMEINYGKYPIRDPKGELLVSIRQNFRDDKTKSDFVASGVNLAKSEVYYRYFKNENLFEAGNEFRVLDLRTTFGKGANVAAYDAGFKDRIVVALQEPRAGKVYLEQFDMNGRFIVTNLDNPSPETSGDYLATSFAYKPRAVQQSDEIYLLGNFNDFRMLSENKCELDTDNDWYECTTLLKQGMYDFVFGTKIGNSQEYEEASIEGNFTQTGNSYEVFVYHKPPAAREERLIGYFLIQNSN